ncbi:MULTISPECIES: hypothetical protein [unclassified Arthrobacter]|uniref:hypothetical protein n=1 Tax=unclassified Arthrobacter TaxID=235627 RepID=UPI001C856FAE|nr:hypothetical protein [Arthrobacter sp. MAHUQ-56]MBX7444517.1 hypothetical protein [Arthrobacter sp. MAHUQ-56]
MFKRILIILAAVFTAFFVMSSPAQAAPPNGNPHFIKNATSASLSGSNLVVSFKETGLPSGQTEFVTASADFSGTYQCLTKSGHNPSDIKKTVTDVPVYASGYFTADKNGNIVGSLTLTPQDPAAALDCPSGQTATLTAWSYTDVVVTDNTSGATLAIPGTYSGGTRVVR